jgi:hypothetical protein
VSEIAVWVGGTIGLFFAVAVAFLIWRKNSPMEEANSALSGNQAAARNAFFIMFAAVFITITIMGDIAKLIAPSFTIPLSAKYVMGLAAALPRYLLGKRQ